jgi:hypothetical protein
MTKRGRSITFKLNNSRRILRVGDMDCSSLTDNFPASSKFDQPALVTA